MVGGEKEGRKEGPRMLSPLAPEVQLYVAMYLSAGAEEGEQAEMRGGGRRLFGVVCNW